MTYKKWTQGLQSVHLPFDSEETRHHHNEVHEVDTRTARFTFLLILRKPDSTEMTYKKWTFKDQYRLTILMLVRNLEVTPARYKDTTTKQEIIHPPDQCHAINDHTHDTHVQTPQTASTNLPDTSPGERLPRRPITHCTHTASAYLPDTCL